jgi:hypothetical protein
MINLLFFIDTKGKLISDFEYDYAMNFLKEEHLSPKR